jgi:hypothetical protein
MNEVDKHARLINNLLELEEAAVLTQIRERLLARDDPFEITEAAQHALRLVGERYARRVLHFENDDGRGGLPRNHGDRGAGIGAESGRK